jgi:hypothetical protein
MFGVESSKIMGVYVGGKQRGNCEKYFDAMMVNDN